AGMAAYDAREAYTKGDYSMMLSHGAEVVADVWAALDPGWAGNTLDYGTTAIEIAATQYEIRDLLHQQKKLQQTEATLQAQLDKLENTQTEPMPQGCSMGRPTTIRPMRTSASRSPTMASPSTRWRIGRPSWRSAGARWCWSSSWMVCSG